MSWSCSTPKVAKEAAESEIDNAMPGGIVEGPVFDQLYAARRAAKELLKTVPGPQVIISMSGHANGVGWQKKAGWSDDCITVSVCQFVE